MARDTGIRTARRISHCFIMDGVPPHASRYSITDAAVNIAPTLKDKVDIRAERHRPPHAPSARPSSGRDPCRPWDGQRGRSLDLDAAALACKMADRGQITGDCARRAAALDNAISRRRAAVKNIGSPVAGRANVLVVPDLEAGNMLAVYRFAGADCAGIVLGAESRSFSRAMRIHLRLGSLPCAVANLFAAARRNQGRTGDPLSSLSGRKYPCQSSLSSMRARRGIKLAAFEDDVAATHFARTHRRHRRQHLVCACSTARARHYQTSRSMPPLSTRMRPSCWQSVSLDCLAGRTLSRSVSRRRPAVPADSSPSSSRQSCWKNWKPSSRSRRANRIISRPSVRWRCAPWPATKWSALTRPSIETQPPVAETFAIPQNTRTTGSWLRIHGISYEYVAARLADMRQMLLVSVSSSPISVMASSSAPSKTVGSVASTMGFTAVGRLHDGDTQRGFGSR